MNISPQFYFHTRQLTRWQQDTHLTELLVETTKMQNPLEYRLPKLQNQRSYMRINWKLKTMLEQTNGTDFCGVNRKTQKRSSNLQIMLCGFPREKNHIWANLRKDGLADSRYNIVYPITLFFLFLFIILNQIQYWSILTS